MGINTLGLRLKMLRTENNLTQEEFGKPYNLKKSTISQYESGSSRPDDELKKQIAIDYNVSLDWLMGNSDIKEPATKILTNIKPDNYSKKEQKNHDTFMEDAKALFMNGELDEDDKEKIFKDISDLFWESKKINKEKSSKKK